MLLAAAALLMVVFGFAAKRWPASPGAQRRVGGVAALTVGLAMALFAARLAPLGLLVVLVGAGLVANMVVRERAARADLGSGGPGETPHGVRRPALMERSEALAVLGLGDDPSDDDVRQAHKQMIVRAHPDQGGSDYLAAKVNEARQVLLGD